MRRNFFVDWFYGIAENLMVKLPDWMTGSSEIMRYKYKMKYGDRDCRLMIRQNKVRVMAVYLSIILLLLVLVLCCFAEHRSDNGEVFSLKRPMPGRASSSIPLRAQIHYQDLTLTKEIMVKVNRKVLTEREKQELLDCFQERLGSLMLGENNDYNYISKPLNLMEYDRDTGIAISWSSSDPERISLKGEVDVIGEKNEQDIILQADLKLGDLSATKRYRLKIDADPGNEALKRSIFERLKDRLGEKAEEGAPVMDLPKELGDGIEIRWFIQKENHMAILIMLCFVAIIIVYLKRYRRIDKEIKEAEESLTRDLPEFINKLVMLLNAGLVVSTAFVKIVNDYESANPAKRENHMQDRRFLYEELTEINKRMDQSNTSLIKELTEFSKRSGVREMVRLTAVISDNWNKGSLLAEKLEGESGLLWLSRKKRAEEKGRLAETKLTFPLMILLLVLIMVTIAPAMLEM